MTGITRPGVTVAVWTTRAYQWFGVRVLIVSLVKIVFETATFDTLNRPKERIEDGGFLDAITNTNRFQDQNSDAANVMLSERTTVSLLQHLDLSNVNATWIHLEAHRLLQEPIRDPKFGTPFEAHHAVWTGMLLIAYQRKIAQAVLKKFGSLLPEKNETRASNHD